MHASRVIFASALASLTLVSAATAAPSDRYVVRNLVSSTAAIPADRIDANIKNAWGLVSSPTSPWWPANNGTDTSTIIPATGAINNTVVPVAGGPTGIVWNGTAGAFPITGGQSSFIFNTMSGAISGRLGGTVAEVKVPAHDAFYMGLALAVTATGPQLYAPDFKDNRVEVYNAQWALVNRDKFVDPTLPANYGPYGIQTVGNRIFVTYAEHVPAGERGAARRRQGLRQRVRLRRQLPRARRVRRRAQRAVGRRQGRPELRRLRRRPADRQLRRRPHQRVPRERRRHVDARAAP